MGWISRQKSSRRPVEGETFFLTSLFIERIDRLRYEPLIQPLPEAEVDESVVAEGGGHEDVAGLDTDWCL